MDTRDSTGTLVTGQSIGGFGKGRYGLQDGVLIEEYDRFLAETSRTRTQEGARTLIADQSIGSYSTKAGAVFDCVHDCAHRRGIPMK
jgi:hypothetical protein